MIINGIDKMSSARLWQSLSRYPNPPLPPAPSPASAPKAVEGEFSTFTKSAEHRLRMMTEDDALEFMAAVTTLMYEPRRTYPPYSAPGPSYHELEGPYHFLLVWKLFR